MPKQRQRRLDGDTEYIEYIPGQPGHTYLHVSSLHRCQIENIIPHIYHIIIKSSSIFWNTEIHKRRQPKKSRNLHTLYLRL